MILTAQEFRDNIENGEYINSYNIIELLDDYEQLLEVVKHYGNVKNWLSTPQMRHINDWYDGYGDHMTGYSKAKEVLSKLQINE